MEIYNEAYIENKCTVGNDIPDSVNVDGEKELYDEYIERMKKQNENPIRNDNGSSEA